MCWGGGGWGGGKGTHQVMRNEDRVKTNGGVYVKGGWEGQRYTSGNEKQEQCEKEWVCGGRGVGKGGQ